SNCPGRGDESGAGRQQEDRRIQDLSRCAARLSCRLSRELSQGRGGRRLAPDAELVQEIRRSRLTPGPAAAIATSRRRRVSQPKRSPLRCGFETCSISQSAQTKAAPRPTTTQRKTRVKAGAVSMVSIPS